MESMVEIGPRWSVKIERIFGTERKMIYKSRSANKQDVSKQEANELKRKRKLINNSKIQNNIENHRRTSEDPARTLLINRSIRGENLE
jgi:hypothetical protein